MKHISVKRQHAVLFLMILTMPLLYNNCSKVASDSSEETLSSNSPLSEKAALASQDELEGTLEVQFEDDFKNQKAYTRHFLKMDSGKRYELQFKKGSPLQKPGSKIRVKGAQSGDQITLESSDADLQLLAAPAPGLSSMGEQKTAVLLVNFQDQPTNKPWTLEQANSLVFGTADGQVNNFFLENSYQQTWFAGTTFGWYTLPINSTDPCDSTNIANAAKAAAASAGVDLSGYSRFVYALPTSSCSSGAAGASSVGSIPSQSFIYGTMVLRTVAHELGHALGLHHSNAYDCDVSPIGDYCEYWAYGDVLDLMGGSKGHFNAYQKEKLGWLNYNISPPIITVESSGNYVIEPLETSGANPRALRILKNRDPVTGAEDWYYLEYRQPIGFDYIFSTNAIYHPENIFNGVIVHLDRATVTTNGIIVGSQVFMLDMTPGSLSGYPRADLDDPALVVGKTYTDAAAGVTITPTSASSSGINVSITLSKPPCTRANPTVVMSPSQSSSVLAGTAVAYTVSVTNKDSSDCSASNFNLQSALPSGFTGAWLASNLSIAPGSSASTTLTVTSSTTTAAGTYNITSTAINSGVSSYRGSASASYVVGTSSTRKGKGRK